MKSNKFCHFYLLKHHFSIILTSSFLVHGRTRLNLELKKKAQTDSTSFSIICKIRFVLQFICMCVYVEQKRGKWNNEQRDKNELMCGFV